MTARLKRVTLRPAPHEAASSLSLIAVATTTTTTASTTTTVVEKRYGTQLKLYSITIIEIECLSDHLGTLYNKYTLLSTS